MELYKNMIGKFSDKIKKNKVRYILILGILGMALIFVSELFSNENVRSGESKVDSILNVSYERETELEKRLAKMIESIDGAGKCSVMITMESTNEYYYASDTKKENNDSKNQNNSEEKFVIFDGENGEEPLILKIGESKVRGVIIVCEGGDNAKTKENIINAVCALLEIKSNSVSVLKMA